MVAAPVGFQCPECVQQASAQQRTVVTPVGGAVITRPVVTYVLIAVNVAAFAVQMLAGGNVVINDYAMFPAGIAYYDEWYRLVTAPFLHGSFLHIAFNMYVLYALGPTLERILGHGRFVAMYLVSALGGAVVSFMISDQCTASVGASGAIFGLMGALVVAGRRLRYDVTQVLILLAINVAIGFFAPNIDWRAHLGGLLTGAVVAAILVYAPRARRVLWQALGVGGLVLILVALALWRSNEIMVNELWRFC